MKPIVDATSTPLSSIFGSGFLIIVPILAGAAGSYSVLAIAMPLDGSRSLHPGSSICSPTLTSSSSASTTAELAMPPPVPFAELPC